MKLFVNLTLILCIAICFVKNCVKCRILEDFESSEQIKLSIGTSMRLGFGVESNYLPIVEFTRYYEPFRFNCTIHTRENKKCNLSLVMSENVDDGVMYTVLQLSENKLILIWDEISPVNENYEILPGIPGNGFIHWVTTLDMDNCKSVNSLKFVWGKNSHKNYGFIVPYKDGFDVVCSTNLTRTSYDSDGNKLNVTDFFLDYIPHSINPISIESRSKGFFVVRRYDDKFKLSLVDVNGREVKQLLESDDMDVVSHVDQSVCTTCWKDIAKNGTIVINCVQFDELGNEKFRKSTVLFDHYWLEDVRSLKEGGLVLFALSRSRKLHASAIRPNQEIETLSYNLRSVLDSRRILDVNETNGTFIFAYKTNIDPEYKQYKVILQKYYLPNVNDKQLDGV